jgi:hypothetical protein
MQIKTSLVDGKNTLTRAFTLITKGFEEVYLVKNSFVATAFLRFVEDSKVMLSSLVSLRAVAKTHLKILRSSIPVAPTGTSIGATSEAPASFA